LSSECITAADPPWQLNSKGHLSRVPFFYGPDRPTCDPAPATKVFGTAPVTGYHLFQGFCGVIR
jgi:hypothetical protein